VARRKRSNINRIAGEKMKKFKQILSKLAENYTEGGTVFNGFSEYPKRTAFNDFGIFRVSEGGSMSRINAFIHKFLAGEYMQEEAVAALIELKSRLNHAGLDLKFNMKTPLNPGQNVFPVKLFGDVFGTTPSTDLSKGFNRGEDMPKLALVVNVEYNEGTCMYSMSGKLSNMTPSSVQEAMVKEPEKKRALSTKEKAKKISKLDESVNKINEEKDPARSVMHYIMRNKDIKNKVLMPVYNHLHQKKKKGKLTLDDARKELYFVVNTAMRKMNSGDKKISLSQKEKSRVVTDLVRNFKTDKK
jgi:hypothetical protein